MSAGKQIQVIRKTHNLTQEQFGNIFHVTRQTVSNWENDNIQPSIEMLMKLAAVFSVSTDYMLGIESGEYLDVSDLPKEVVAHLRQIVDDLRAK